MKNLLSANEIFHKLQLADDSLKLTELRKEVLKIIIQAKKPISAYEILEKLKKRRDSAEPPTVYRVIEYFSDKHIIHKIAAQNKYVLCSQLDEVAADSHGLIFICKECLSSYEITDASFLKTLKQLAENQQFSLDGSLVEIKGLCSQCAKHKNLS